MIAPARLESLLAAFPRLSIALVGDLFLDRYLEIDSAAGELSIETGLIAHQVTRVRNAAGALGTVMNNLAALGVGRLVPVTVIGDDGHGYDLRRELARLPVDTQYVFSDPARLTPTYTKPLETQPDGTRRELNRLDVRTRAPLSAEMQDSVLRAVEKVFHETNGLIVLDQINEENWGVVGAAVRESVTTLARHYPDKLVFVDSRAHLGKFTGGVLKANRTECLAAVRDAPMPAERDPVHAAAQALAARTGRTMFCTVGEKGILVARPSGEISLVPALPVSGPIDIVGAGDSATAGIVASLLCGASDIEAAAAGNLAASITIQKLGTTGTATPAEMLDRCRAAASAVRC